MLGFIKTLIGFFKWLITKVEIKEEAVEAQVKNTIANAKTQVKDAVIKAENKVKKVVSKTETKVKDAVTKVESTAKAAKKKYYNKKPKATPTV